ncbi:heavy metal translocating P-type ATPase [Paracoccus sp. DMF-8]|uniref:heavy metal translocating P-type ATPase n=1 Tax=Paracoccus sp. DMF-8 TaxID=3019445 RepID=UPI0023E7A175|nr:heavy metal translocating P-type ATPase [Paracoccus sp. DMF-8]MDF3605545.1 heavy metal translocating P-type ATPase [Paracoccus sp. DMF-8]
MSDATAQGFEDQGSDSRLSACPACDVAPIAMRIAQEKARKDEVILSLPGIHCATCITDIERALNNHPGVDSARVNLTLRRVTVKAPGLGADDLIPVVERAGYEALELDPSALSSTAADRKGRDLLMRTGVAGFAMMNVMLLSVAVWSGAEGATRDLFHMVSAMIALPTIAFAGQPFFANARRGLRHGKVVMDFPISLALILASGMSLYETMNSGRHAYFDGVVTLCFFLLIGRYLDYRTRAVARSAAEELTALEVPRAFRITDTGEELVPVAALVPGDLIRIRPGSRVPADGRITSGESEIDRSLLTGESLPVVAAPGTMLSAGEVNLTGLLTVRVTAAGRDSSLAQLTELVANAESARGRYTTLAQQASALYTPIVHIVAFGSFLGWMIHAGDLRMAVNVAAAVLIITCPCALGLAVPAVMTAASGRLFRKGLLIKDATALERLSEVDTVIFDKTGTLTMGTPQLVDPDVLPVEHRPVALALTEGSSHPLSRALAHALATQGVTAVTLERVTEVPGHGVEGLWQGQPVRIGRADWIGAAPGQGRVASTWLRIADLPPIRLEFEDRMRPGAEEAVAGLRRAGCRVMLLSGDTQTAVADIAGRLGIAEWRAGVTPVDKAEAVTGLGAQGARILMVGDGLNDTAALAAAHVAISPASALDAARVASDIVLMGTDLRPVPEALAVARSARKRIKENFNISFGYNIFAVPIAILGFATPLIAALAMSLSSICVTLNALRLR